MAKETGAKSSEAMEPADAGQNDYVSLPVEEELARLRKLPTADLVNELFFSRQRLRTFLEEKGIPVPDFVIDSQTHKTLLDLTASSAVDNFSRDTIRGIGEDVEAVNSSVKSFVMLFDSLISTNSFEQVMVSVEGAEEPCTVKQLLENYDNSRIDEDRRVVIAVRDLKSQLSSLIDENSSGSKSFEDVDDDDIAATRSSDAADEDKSYRSRLGQGAYAFGQFSPFISQEMLDGMMAKQESAEAYFSDKLEDHDGEQDEWGGDRSGNEEKGKGEDINLFDDDADVPDEQKDIFDDFYSADDKTPSAAGNKVESLSADDIEKLMGSK